jgi:hypothetical protein
VVVRAAHATSAELNADWRGFHSMLLASLGPAGESRGALVFYQGDAL